MKSDYKKLEDKLLAEIGEMASAMSKVISSIEMKVEEVKNDNQIIMKQLTGFSNRLNYLEKKVLK